MFAQGASAEGFSIFFSVIRSSVHVGIWLFHHAEGKGMKFHSKAIQQLNNFSAISYCHHKLVKVQVKRSLSEAKKSLSIKFHPSELEKGSPFSNHKRLCSGARKKIYNEKQDSRYEEHASFVRIPTCSNGSALVVTQL